MAKNYFKKYFKRKYYNNRTSYGHKWNGFNKKSKAASTVNHHNVFTQFYPVTCVAAGNGVTPRALIEIGSRGVSINGAAAVLPQFARYKSTANLHYYVKLTRIVVKVIKALSKAKPFWVASSPHKLDNPLT